MEADENTAYEKIFCQNSPKNIRPLEKIWQKISQ